MKIKIMGVSLLIAGILGLEGCNWGTGNNGLLRGGFNKKNDQSVSETLNSGEVIVQQGTPYVEEGATYVIGQPTTPVTPGITSQPQTVPPPLNPQNTLPLSPTPNNNPAPKLVPQAQPTPASPTSRIIN